MEMGRRSHPRKRRQASKKPRTLRLVVWDFSDANFEQWATWRNEMDAA